MTNLRFTRGTATHKVVHVGPAEVLCHYDAGCLPRVGIVLREGEAAVRWLAGNLESLSEWVYGDTGELLAFLDAEFPRLARRLREVAR